MVSGAYRVGRIKKAWEFSGQVPRRDRMHVDRYFRKSMKREDLKDREDKAGGGFARYSRVGLESRID